MTTLPRRETRRLGQTDRIVDAAQRLLYAEGDSFTIQGLVEEAGCALQTFYRHFPSKDHLLLAVLAKTISRSCAELEEATRSMKNPIDRLHFYVTAPLHRLAEGDTHSAQATTHEHFRLHQLFPQEVAQATRPFATIVLASLEHASARGLAGTDDPAADAQTITRLVMTTFHYYAFSTGGDLIDEAEKLWQFVARAIIVSQTSDVAVATRARASATRVSVRRAGR